MTEEYAKLIYSNTPRANNIKSILRFILKNEIKNPKYTDILKYYMKNKIPVKKENIYIEFVKT